MDSNDNDEEVYIEHLRTLFNELDPSSKGGLNKKELKKLSKKLSLGDSQSDLLIELSFPADEKSLDYTENRDSDGFVNFSKFQESFVAVLSATAAQPLRLSDTDDGGNDVVTDSYVEPDIKPRVVHKGKAYGRRSQPDLFDVEMMTDHNRTNMTEKSDHADASDDETNASFGQDFDELPIRGQGDGLYFEAHGLLRNPLLDRLRPKSASTSLNESQINVSSTSIVMQQHHLFTELDKDDIGFIHYNDLVEMWVSEGVPDPKHVLQLLDVPVDRDVQINAYDLTRSLQKELDSLRSSTVDTVTQAVLATYKHHITHMNEQIEQHQALLGKMRDDLEHTELRNSRLIDEADDRYLRIDKSKEKLLFDTEQVWNRKFREAREKFDKEKEVLHDQAMLERDALQQEIERLVIREGSLRSTIEALQLDNDALERETKELVKKLQESESNSARLQCDLEDLIREKANMSTDSLNVSQEERFSVIIKDYEAQCTALTDRNDELVAEIEKLRSEFLHSFNNKSRDDKPNSRKRARRRNSREYIKKSEQQSTDGSDTENDECVVELSKRVSELEKVIRNLEEEKRALTTRFNEEKATSRAQLESEFQIKLDKERKRMTAFEEMSKSDKKKSINQALLDSNKERDELEKRIRDLQAALQSEQANTQQSISNLCREFEKDKAEIQSKNDELVEQVREEASNLRDRLEKETEAHEMTAQQLKNDRKQHEAAMRTHTDAMAELQKSAVQSDAGDKHEIKRLTRQLQEYEQKIDRLESDKIKALAEHRVALDLAEAEMRQTMEETVAQRQKEENLSVQSELNRMHDSVAEERQRMQQRIDCLREAFNVEAEELKTLVEREKAEFSKALAEEREVLKRRLEDENKMAAERKRQECSEEETSRKEQQSRRYEEIIDNLRSTKISLETDLRNALDDKHDLEKQLLHAQSTKQQFSSPDSAEHPDVNSVLQSQVSEWRRKHFDVCRELSDAKKQREARSAEIAHLAKEKQELADKIVQLESEKSSFQVQNARLLSRNVQLGVHEDERMSEEHRKRVSEMIERLEEKETLCEQLRAKLKKYQAIEEAANTVKKFSLTDLKTKYETTRLQLIQQMNKTKDMYSKLNRSEGLIKDLYCENAQLMRSLQVAEDKFKASDRKIAVEVEKNHSLTLLLRKICPQVA